MDDVLFVFPSLPSEDILAILTNPIYANKCSMVVGMCFFVCRDEVGE